MCGIFGIWHRDSASVEPSVVRRATAALRHRGPDDEGYLFVETRAGCASPSGGRETDPALSLPSIERLDGGSFDLAFGFRRLSILDLSPAGHQPMASADRKCWIIFNGEIYNYVELRDELTHCGHEFRTGTDTEVVLAAYQRWGAHCVKRFTGMWAFAIWDGAERRLFLSRDPFGIKPLYYINEGGRFAFASEIKALLELPSVSRRANPQRLYDYLAAGLTDHGGETMFAGIRQLLPGHSLTLAVDDAGEEQLQQYWQIDLNGRLDLSFEEAAARLRELFLESVKLHLRSDVPIGAALSGGIDSSSITMAMRSLEPRLDLRAFSYTADDAAINEERWIDIIGDAAGAKVHKVRPTPEELVADLDDLITTQEEPFGSTSIYAQHRVFRLAREAGVTVMLDGQGADEMLAGYRTYLVPRLASLLRQGQLVRANRFFRQTLKISGMSSGALLASTSGKLFPSLIGRGRIMPSFLRPFAKRLGLVNGSVSRTGLNNEWFARHGVASRQAVSNGQRFLLRKSLQETIVETSLPMLLRYEDRNSMAHSIESRVPFLTTSLVEFILALPEEYLLAPDGTSKSVFRRAMRGLVPDPILDRRDKIGFATPERHWLAAIRSWVQGVLESDTAARIPALNLSMIRQEWQEVLAGRQPFDFRIWHWLNVIRWVDQFKISF